MSRLDERFQKLRCKAVGGTLNSEPYKPSYGTILHC